MLRDWALRKPIVLLLAVAGCSGGSIGSSSHAGGEGSGGSASGTGGSGSGSGNASAGGTSSGSGGSAAVDCTTPPAAESPLRRLTRFEYENTVRDLLNVDPSPARDLPNDEVTNGFDNNARVLTVSSLHAEKYVLVAEALAAAAVQNLSALTSCDPTVTGEEACAREFAQRVGRRAFRRPITAQDEQLLMTAYAAGRDGGSHTEGIEVMIRAMLQSPHFLYRLELPGASDAAGAPVPLGPFELATRLSYLIWASGPDDALLDAAERGELGTKEQVTAKAREMLSSPKAQVGLNNFFKQWSSLSRLDIITKNTTLFPSFDGELRAAMAAELPALIEHAFATEPSLRTLLTSNVAFVDGPLAALYGVAPPAGNAGLQPVELPTEQGRAGLLTQAGFLSVQAHPDQTSPVLRGKFVRSMLLCQPPPLPPDDVDISLPEVDQGGTARERFSAHLDASTTCAGCHASMDPIGFAFEHFDAMGQYRTTDNGQPIDASGEVMGPPDPVLGGAFYGVRELAEKLAQSEHVRSCLATQLFRYGAGRSEAEGDTCSIADIQAAFNAADGDLVELVVAMTGSHSFLHRAPVSQ